MKNLFTLISFAYFVVFGYAQNDFDEISADYKKRNPIYDYSENILNNTDTIPDFETKPNKLKITGTIFESDGVTPAKDVLLYMSQSNENGDYEIKSKNDKRYIHHSGWIKTNAEGKYTFYTFIPGSAIIPITFPRRRGPKQILPVIKEPGKPEYDLNAFLFEDDPLLTKSCRKRLKRRGIDCILKLEKNEDIYVATKNIVLEQNTSAYK
jgi:protocatechuate 3,4-dioxygenase beta subunit